MPVDDILDVKLGNAEQKAEKPKEEPKKPKIDHSVPPRERIEKERDGMKFEGIMLQDFNRYAVTTTARLINVQFDLHPELLEEWDKNEWTLKDFQQAVAERMRKEAQEAKHDIIFSGDEKDEADPLMVVFREIMKTKNEPKKIEMPKPTTAPAETKAKPEPKKEKPKPTPKQEQDTRQLLLDLGL